MANVLPISGIVDIDVILSPLQPSAPAINTDLILGTSTVIDTVEREREYLTLTAVEEDFGSSAPEYLAALLWFGQNPQPESLWIGRWVNVASAGQLIGGGISAADMLVSAWTGITSGSCSIFVDGIPYALTGMNFAEVTNLNGVASVIQTALLTATSGTQTVVYNSIYNNFVVTDDTTGTSSVIGFIASPRGIGSAAFSTQPAANDTLTIDGVAITFVSSGPTGNEVLIGSTLADTLANLETFLSSQTSGDLALMTYYVVGSTLYIQSIATGTAGDFYALAKISAAITLSGSTLAGGAGTDISAMTSCTSSSSGAYQAPGLAAESAVSAVALFDENFAGRTYGLQIIGAQDTDYEAIAAYIEGVAPAHYFGITTSEAGVLVPTDTSDIAYILQQLAYNHSAVQYSSQNPYAIVSYMARILTTNWEGQNTAICLMFKQEPGVTPENLSVPQAAAAQAKNCNYYAYRGSVAEIEYGTSCSGQFTDTVIGADWLAGALQTAGFDALEGATTKIPQTDAGMSILLGAYNSVCEQAVTNGYAAPGEWNSAGFGTLEPGQTLSSGFYTWAPPMASQREATRQTRAAPVAQIAIKNAGAIQSSDVIVTVQQ